MLISVDSADSADSARSDLLRSADWRRSSFSGALGNCVELALAGPLVGIRDSKRPAAGALVLPDAARSGLLAFAAR